MRSNLFLSVLLPFWLFLCVVEGSLKCNDPAISKGLKIASALPNKIAISACSSYLHKYQTTTNMTYHFYNDHLWTRTADLPSSDFTYYDRYIYDYGLSNSSIHGRLSPVPINHGLES
jgi:hypothetical protein